MFSDAAIRCVLMLKVLFRLPLRAAQVGAEERSETIRAIKHLGRRLWKRRSGCHRCSPAETAMSRLERLGERLAARDLARQAGRGAEPPRHPERLRPSRHGRYRRFHPRTSANGISTFSSRFVQQSRYLNEWETRHNRSRDSTAEKEEALRRV